MGGYVCLIGGGVALWGAVCAMRGVGCARLRRAGAGERAERGEGSRERQGQRDSIADGTALRCGRVGSRHFQKP